MDSKLLVRLYNVGLGDCIYLRVPDKNRNVHILIDCGNKFNELKVLGDHIAELKKELPNANGGKKRLDLLVVTHPHEDHHKGFEEEFFKDIKIDRIWLSPAFDRADPKAQGFHALQDAAHRALQGLAETALGDLKEQVEDLLNLSKDEAIDMLCNTLPAANGIKPVYVTADTPTKQLLVFDDPAIKLKVLGPMGDIDAYYLGGEGLISSSEESTSKGLAAGYQSFFQASNSVEVTFPKNVSFQDFEMLCNHIHANALAAAEVAGHAVNNLSIVLLLEWHGRRLLFPGDAEWKESHEGAVKNGTSNGSWNVMWKERHAELSQPLDFLKIGHHGSENATPWTPSKKGKTHPINKILDTLLPLPKAGKTPTAKAIVSTQRTSRWPSIPDAVLMEELGKRVANVRKIYKEKSKSPKAVPANTPQPQRTDLEAQATKTPREPVFYIEIEFPPL